MAFAQMAVSTPQQIYQTLKEKIIAVDILPGVPLAEQKLAGEFGVSRTPVRECLLRLASEGLVEIAPNRGATVAPIRIAAVQTAQFVRQSLETSVALVAAGKIDQHGEMRLRHTIEEQKLANASGEPQRFYTADERLHRTISEIAELPLVWSHIEDAKLQMDRVRHLNLMQARSFDELISQHERIVMAICNKDEPDIRAALHDHLGQVLPDLYVMQHKRPELFAR